MAQIAEKSLQKANYGLRREILSPMEFRGHDPAGVRACRQRHMSCLCAGDGGRVACRVMHRPLCPPFVVARFALRLCITDSATVAQRDRRVESLAGVCGYGIQCHRWFSIITVTYCRARPQGAFFRSQR